MKRIISIWLLSFYLTLSIVSYVSVHYCHGQLKSFGLGKMIENTCCPGDEAFSSACCKHILVSIDFDTDQLVAQFCNAPNPPDFSLFLSSKLFEEKNSVSLVHLFNSFESPPDIPVQELYILNNSFIFYG